MVLIKDLEIPFSCDRCRLLNRHYNECRVTWKKVSNYEERKPKWCPLTEVVAYGPDGILYKEK